MNRVMLIAIIPFVFAIVSMFVSCEEDDPLAPNVALRGRVTNNSGATGAVVVEIDYYLRDTADVAGNFEIKVHQDLLVDSLYAWVDKDGNEKYTNGEPYGFYHSQSAPSRALAFHVRDQDVSNLNFDIPGQ